MALDWAAAGGGSLRRAKLRSADLREVRLVNADLSFADLRRANLAGAKLEGADLRGADLHKADLRLANLLGAIGGCAVLDARTTALIHNDQGGFVLSALLPRAESPQPQSPSPGDKLTPN